MHAWTTSRAEVRSKREDPLRAQGIAVLQRGRRSKRQRGRRTKARAWLGRGSRPAGLHTRLGNGEHGCVREYGCAQGCIALAALAKRRRGMGLAAERATTFLTLRTR